MSETFIPNRDTDALAFCQTFSNALTADPGKYNVTSADALMIAGTVTAFQSALAVVTNPATKTEVAVTVKDEARAACEEVIRLFAAQIKVNAGISDSDKQAIGIKPPTTTRTPIPAPATMPLLSFLGTTPDGSQTLRYSDSSTPDSRARPYGYQSVQLFRVIAAEQADDPANAQFYGAFTRNPIAVAFRSSDNGKWCTYFARWANTKGEAGPWSNPLSVPIATTLAEAA
jgi:hypothetical protein